MKRQIPKAKSQSPNPKNGLTALSQGIWALGFGLCDFSAHFPSRVSDLLFDHRLVDIAFITLQGARPGRNGVLPATALGKHVAIMFLHRRIALHLLGGRSEVLLRLVIISAPVVRPAEAIEEIRVVRLDVQRSANQTNGLI